MIYAQKSDAQTMHKPIGFFLQTMHHNSTEKICRKPLKKCSKYPGGRTSA